MVAAALFDTNVAAKRAVDVLAVSEARGSLHSPMVSENMANKVNTTNQVLDQLIPILYLVCAGSGHLSPVHPASLREVPRVCTENYMFTILHNHKA